MLKGIGFGDFPPRNVKVSISSRRNARFQDLIKFVNNKDFIEKLNFAREVRRFYGYDVQKHIGFLTSRRVDVQKPIGFSTFEQQNREN